MLFMQDYFTGLLYIEFGEKILSRRKKENAINSGQICQN